MTKEIESSKKRHNVSQVLKSAGTVDHQSMPKRRCETCKEIVMSS